MSDTFSNEEIFNNHIPISPQTLKVSGFNNNLIYRQSQENFTHPRKTGKAQTKNNLV